MAAAEHHAGRGGRCTRRADQRVPPPYVRRCPPSLTPHRSLVCCTRADLHRYCGVVPVQASFPHLCNAGRLSGARFATVTLLILIHSCSIIVLPLVPGRMFGTLRCLPRQLHVALTLAPQNVTSICAEVLANPQAAQLGVKAPNCSAVRLTSQEKRNTQLPTLCRRVSYFRLHPCIRTVTCRSRSVPTPSACRATQTASANRVTSPISL